MKSGKPDPSVLREEVRAFLHTHENQLQMHYRLVDMKPKQVNTEKNAQADHQPVALVMGVCMGVFIYLFIYLCYDINTQTNIAKIDRWDGIKLKLQPSQELIYKVKGQPTK